MFLIQLTYKKPIELVDQYLAEHRAFLQEGYNNNFFIVSGPCMPRTGGIILSQLQDRKILEEILSHDPFFVHDLADYAYIEFNPVKYHPSFSTFIE
jgi:uncharacterized protein YciI